MNTVLVKAKKTIEQHNMIEKGDHIIVGLSGGPDSVCLLSLLWELKELWDINLHAVHVNHCLRGKDADEDQKYAESLCQSLKIPCHTFTYNVTALAAQLKITTEEAGRKVRYQSFDRVKNEIGVSNRVGITGNPKVKIAIAHNLNDQAETLLMRIIRGTGTDGLAGIEYFRDGTIIRPLLDISREEIEEYCIGHRLNPRIDLTNMEPMYTRNKIRLELLPLLQEKYNASIMSALNRLSVIASEDKDYIYKEVDKARNAVSKNENGVKILRKTYTDFHPAIGKRLILTLLKEMDLEQDMTALHLESADGLMRNGKTGDRIGFPHGYGLRLTYDYGCLYKTGDEIHKIKAVNDESNHHSYSFTLNEAIKGCEIQATGLNAIFKTKVVENIDSSKTAPNIAYIDISSMDENQTLDIRTRRPGDVITPSGMKGSKKLQDFFVDIKLPRELRNEIPLLSLGKEIIWVAGIRINEKFVVNQHTNHMLSVEYIHKI